MAVSDVLEDIFANTEACWHKLLDSFKGMGTCRCPLHGTLLKVLERKGASAM